MPETFLMSFSIKKWEKTNVFLKYSTVQVPLKIVLNLYLWLCKQVIML